MNNEEMNNDNYLNLYDQRQLLYEVPKALHLRPSDWSTYPMSHEQL
jgi:hypothetical protein